MAGHAHVISALLAMSAMIDRMDSRGITPLILAARHGHEDAVKVLVEWGVGKNCLNEALHEIARNGNVALARCLLQSGADVDSR